MRLSFRTKFSAPKFIILLFLVAYNASLYAQVSQDTLRFMHIKSGMSQSTATVIFEDSQGYLWIGTGNGLNKYDGTDFDIFEKSVDGENGLTDGYIRTIYEDTDTNLYLGTPNGLSFYDRKLDLVQPYPFLSDEAQIQHQSITSIKRTEEFLWLGTDGNGLFRYNILDGNTKKLTFGPSEKGQPNNNYIIDLFQLPNNNLLVFTQGSRYIIDGQLHIKKRFRSSQFTSKALALGRSKFMCGTKNGTLIGLEVVDNNLVRFDSLDISLGHTITALEKDGHGNLWVGIENYGLSIYDINKNSHSNFKVDHKRPYSLSGNSIRSICRDSNGTMWVGYFKKGISFYDSDFYKFEHIRKNPFNPKSLSNDIVNCFSEDPSGNLWIGTDGGGLNYWDRKSGLIEHFSYDNGKSNSNVVLSILPYEKNQLWVGSWGMGLAIFDLETMAREVLTKENSFLASNNTRDMLLDKKGRIWIASFNGGLQVYYPETKTHKNISLTTDDGKEVITVARLYEDDKGNLWVGTLMGLFKLKEHNDNWSLQRYSSTDTNHSLSNDFVNAIIQDNQGTLWVGTEAGLNKYIPQEDTFTNLGKTDGLRNDAIKGIIQDEHGALWLSTGAGMVKYHEKTNEFSDYGVHDGLQGSEFNANSFYRTSRGEMLFGGNNGFNIFTADQAKKNMDSPKIVISGLKIFNKPIRPDDSSGILKENIAQADSITLRYDQSVIDLEFSALTFRNAKNVSYAYFLEGFETDWNYVDNKTTATYTNLNPGTYTFRLKSTNSDAVWTGNEKTLAITITPPFWETWWFRLLLVLFVLAMITLAYKIRMRSIKHYQAKLKHEIKVRTSELEQQQKKLAKTAEELSEKNEEIQRFTFAVSHDLKSPLNNIRGIAGIIPLELGPGDNTEIEKCLELINTSCDIMSNLIADVTEIAKLGKIENKKEFLDTNEIMQLIRDLVKGKLDKFDVELRIASDLPPIYGDKNRILQVFGNLVDNAIKYMGDQEQPIIQVDALDLGDSIQFTVRDNGSGMSKDALQKLFSPFKRFHSKVKGTGLGLYMTKQIVESHDGKISATSQGKGLGASFSVRLPKVDSTKVQNDKKQQIPEISLL